MRLVVGLRIWVETMSNSQPALFSRPLHAEDAEQSIQAFINQCKGDFFYVHSDISWDANYWPAPYGVNFCNIKQASRVLNPGCVFLEPFLGFAKAWIFYEVQARLGKNTASRILSMLKCLDVALRDRKAEIWQVDVAVLDASQDVAREKYAASAAYSVGKELECLVAFLAKHCLLGISTRWKSSLKAPRDSGRVGAEARKQAENALPDPELIKAIGQVFASSPTSPKDIVTTSVCAIMLPVPERIGEVLNLSVDCLVDDHMRDGRPVLGIRFRVGKGGFPRVKHVQPEMAPIVREAIARLRCLGEEARRAARWHEENPGRFYRHAHCPNVPDEQPLCYQEVAAAMGWSGNDRQIRSTIRNAGLPSEPNALTLEILGDYVFKKRLPADFPWIDRNAGIRYSEGLFCIRESELHGRHNPSPVILTRVSRGVLSNELGVRRDGSGEMINSGFFGRHYPHLVESGNPRIRTGQFRHQITTMAFRGMLSAEDIAWWSGRVNLEENKHYQHMLPQKMAEMIRARDPSLKVDDSIKAVIDRLSKRIPMTREDFLEMSMRTAHVTEFGFCVHDYIMSPCQRYLDCMSCTDHVCIKGDSRLSGLYSERDSILELVRRAREEMDHGSTGADRWYEVQCRRLEQLNSLLDIIENPAVEAGTIVRVSGSSELGLFERAHLARTRRLSNKVG